MIRVYDAQTSAELGEISEEQLRFLTDQMEEESTEDRDYYINQATVDMFEGRGADPALIAFLRRALGAQEEMDIRWQRA